MRKRSAAAVLLVSVAALVGLAATPAMALDRPPSPGAGNSWGLNYLDLKTNPFDGDVTGGWSAPTGVSTFAQDAPGTPPRATTPLSWKLSEPWRMGNSTIGVTIYLTYPQDNRDPKQNATAAFGTPTYATVDAGRSYVMCSADVWSTTQNRVYFGGRTIVTPSLGLDNRIAVTIPTDCWNITQIHVAIAVPKLDGASLDTITTVTSLQSDWIGERWFNQTPYAAYDPIKDVCLAMRPDDAELVESCKDYVDIGLENYCAEPPSWDLWQGETYAEVIGFYADCLFHPRGDWDDAGHIAASWEGGAGGAIGEQLETVYEGYRFAPVCGVIAQGDFLGSPFAIDSCPWTAWAGPLREVLNWGVWIGFGFWVLSFLTRTITGLLGGRMPSPLEEEK